MRPDPNRSCTAFSGQEKIASGPVAEVALALKTRLDADADFVFLVFDDLTSAPVELDLRGTPADVLDRLQNDEVEKEERKVGPGRPKLGVIAREVTLLPRHWEWLATQRGGASATLRQLIEDAKRKNGDKDRRRQAQEATYKFMSVQAGNLPHFENALRALYANQKAQFAEIIAGWPSDIREHVMMLAHAALDE